MVWKTNHSKRGFNRRSVYSLVGQVIAQRQKEEMSTPQLVDTFSDNNASGWTARAGSWSVVATPPNGYAYKQTGTGSATNSTYNLTQTAASSYEWEMTFQSANRKAGLYFFASDVNNHTYHGNSYSVWQTETQLQICENTASGNSCSGVSGLTAANGETHQYRAVYDRATGRIDVWRDGVYALSRVDSSPLTGGNHIALKTQGSTVRFDNVRVTLLTGTLVFFYGDHLGSTSLMYDATAGQVVAGSQTRHLPFGGYRGAAPTQTVTDRGFTGHKQNDDLGLIYMNARYYVPYINRFVSADSIVPDPANPQSYNRYSYARNNPLKFVDPTGHRECNIETLDCSGEPIRYEPHAPESRELETWELHALMQAVFSESNGGSLSPGHLKFLAWIYLNRISSGKWQNMGTAVYSGPPIGYTADGVPIFSGSPQSSAGVLWAEVRESWTLEDVPDLVEERWATNKDPNWAIVEGVVNTAYADWFYDGMGSANDPTHGSYWYGSETHTDENHGGISRDAFEALITER
ncbi:MAG: DUF1080 domain-containing protein, partial [Anaerolineae bacterium]|nr:DUF1080 domain-containing protein [Anaerolineae bacterium]